MRQNPLNRATILSFALPISIAGCTGTLPAPEAIAFRTLATADKDAFTGVAQRNAEAGVARSQRLLGENVGEVKLRLCAGGEEGECVVTYSVNNVEYRFATAAPNTRALIGSIVRYSDQMAELAEAKDLDTVKTKAEAAAGAVKALSLVATPAGGPIIGAIVDAALMAGNAGLRDKRRRALLTVARAAREPVKVAAAELGTQSTLLKDDLVITSADATLEIRNAIIKNQNAEKALLMGRKIDDRGISAWRRGEVFKLRDRRMADLAALAESSANLNQARQLETKYDSLVTAHEALIKKLENPRISIEDAMRDINVVLTALDAATKKPAS